MGWRKGQGGNRKRKNGAWAGVMALEMVRRTQVNLGGRSEFPLRWDGWSRQDKGRRE